MRCEIFSSNNEVKLIYSTKTICTYYIPVTVYDAKDLEMNYLFLVPVYKKAQSTTGEEGHENRSLQCNMIPGIVEV